MWLLFYQIPSVHILFLLTHPVWDVTNNTGRVRKESQISTHTSRVGCDRSANGFKITNLNFYSHIPCGMWRIHDHCLDSQSYFYSHIPCGMWHSLIYFFELVSNISTHTSRVGCDGVWFVINIICRYFYSHIPCGMWPLTYMLLFVLLYFYSHIPCGMWPYYDCFYSFFSNISTHTSRVGCDTPSLYAFNTALYFYSHIPCGMWLTFSFLNFFLSNFYSHIPCGMWLWYV